MAKVDAQVSATEKPSLAPNTSEAPLNIINFSEKTTINNAGATLPPEAIVSNEEITKSGKNSDIALLDRESLLGCIVRTIPPNGRIRISSTVSE